MSAGRMGALIALQAMAIAALAGWILLHPGGSPVLPAAASGTTQARPAGAGGAAPAVGLAGAGGPAVTGGATGQDAGEAGGEGGDGLPVVHLSDAVQHASGVRVAALSAARAPVQVDAWGEVLSPQGLADSRLRLRQAATDAVQWDVPLAQAVREHERLETLWRDGGNVARKLVDQAASEQAQLEARQAAARSLQEAVRAAVRAEWGEILSRELERPEGGALAGVLAQREVLLLIAADAPARARVAVAGAAGGTTVPASRLAPAARALVGALRPSWYWLAPAAALRAGDRIRLIDQTGSLDGVRVPESAVVWQAGQSWVYLAVDGEHFRRQAVSLGAPLGDGWFAGPPLRPAAEVVVQGAQLVLSEESRALIRNENGD